MIVEEPFKLRRRTIASLDPDDFGRMSVEKTELMKIRIFGHNSEAVRLCEIP
jgi:hypothetical protein